jgi:hypothetical protein
MARKYASSNLLISSSMGGQAVRFRTRERPRDPIDGQHELVCLLPHDQVLECLRRFSHSDS